MKVQKLLNILTPFIWVICTILMWSVWVGFMTDLLRATGDIEGSLIVSKMGLFYYIRNF